MDVLVFKTNIPAPNAKPLITERLTQLRGVSSWSIDFEDRDKVLRIEALDVSPHAIVNAIASAGFRCEELA